MKKGLDHAHTNIALSIIGIVLVFLSVVIGSLVLSEMMKSTVPAEESSVDTTTASQEAVVSTAIYHHSDDIEAEIELLQYKPNDESTIEYGEESSSVPEKSSVVDPDDNVYEVESTVSTESESSSTSTYSNDIEEESLSSDVTPDDNVYEVESTVSTESESSDVSVYVTEEKSETSEDIKSASVETETENTYTDEDLYYLTCVIVGEGQNVTFEEQIAVASVVINRLNSEWFNYDTIREVCTAPGQYSSFSNGMAYREPTEENIAAAKYVLENGSQLPGNCIFQSLHQQGNGVYKYFEDTGTYICYK